jgi:hypothetical protein
MNNVLSSIITLKNNIGVTKEEALQNLQFNRDKLTGLKRRLTDDYLHQSNIYESIKKRVSHVSSASIDVLLTLICRSQPMLKPR